MPSAERHFRGVFNEVAELYDRARPDYPQAVFDDIARLANLGRDSHVLEIGCGTGQATLPLARAGYGVVGVELGDHLAEIARHKLKAFSNVRIDIGAFEDWPGDRHSFDLVLSATAFHWIAPDVRMQKVADCLKPGASFALIDTIHISGGTNEFFLRAQECYRRWDPSVPEDFQMPSIDALSSDSPDFDATGLFGPVVLRRYVREISYSADAYIDLLRTYSGQSHLPKASRVGLYDDLHALITNDFGGTIVKAYLTDLRIAKRLES